MKAVIPAAGLGTRFLPYTKAQPKEMIPVVDKPAIQYVVEEAVEAGLRDILIVTGRSKRAIEDHFDVNVELDRHLAESEQTAALQGLKDLMDRAKILYVRQPVPRGLGDAVLHAESFVAGEDFAVLLGDDITVEPPCIAAVHDAQARLGGCVLGLQEVPRALVGRYGIVTARETEPGIVRIEDIVEKPSPKEAESTLATIGRYVLTADIFPTLHGTKPGAGGEIQLTDGIRGLLKTEDVHGVVYRGRRYDVGDKIGWLRANIELAAERPDLREELLASLQSILAATRGGAPRPRRP